MTAITSSRIKQMSPQLLVADLERSIDFYTVKLGFDIAFLHEDFYAGLTKDNFSIHLKHGRPLAGVAQNKKDNEHLDIFFSVEGIDDLYKEFASKSVAIIQPLRNMPYGREFYVTDPDGYILGFLEPM